METKSLGFIGGGRITKIFLQAFATKNTEFQAIVVYDTNTEVMMSLKHQFPQIEIADDVYAAAGHSTVIIALHPPVIMETLDKIADSISRESLFISLAPKITIEKIAAKLKTRNIARIIPNATSYINEGYNPMTFGPGFDESEKNSLLKLANLLGYTFEVEESKLEAYALMSAMLPTYFWFQWNELFNLGIQMGLSEEESKASVKQTLIAAINLMFNTELSPEQVMDLIPVKPIVDYQKQICEIYHSKLLSLYEKIKP
jgi:pyrroline-5-carboxylate reductase